MSDYEPLERNERNWNDIHLYASTLVYQFNNEQLKLNVFLDNKPQDIIPLHIEQCISRINGARCPRYADLTHPYCIKCLPQAYKIRFANLAKSGFHLFAFDPQHHNDTNIIVFKKKEKVAPMLGEILTNKLFRDRYRESFLVAPALKLSHIWVVEPDQKKTDSCKLVSKSQSGIIYDALRYRGPGFYAAHSTEPNCKLKHVDGTLWLVAIKDIRNTEEICLAHGDQQWNCCKCTTIKIDFSLLRNRKEEAKEFHEDIQKEEDERRRLEKLEQECKDEYCIEHEQDVQEEQK